MGVRDNKDNKYNGKPRIIRQGKPVTEETKEKLRQAVRQQRSASPGVDPGVFSNGGIKKAMEKKRTQNNEQAMKKLVPTQKARIVNRQRATPDNVSAAYERAFGKRKK